MNKETLQLFSDYYSCQSSAIWQFEKIEFFFECKNEDFLLYSELKLLMEGYVSEWYISFKMFEKTLVKEIEEKKRSRIGENAYPGLVRAFLFLLEKDEEAKKIADQLFSNCEAIAKVRHETADSNSFFSKAYPKFKKLKKSFKDFQKLLEERVQQIRDNLVKGNVPISLPHTSIDEMSPKELEFYKRAKVAWDKNTFIDIEDNENYVWVYIRELLYDKRKYKTDDLLHKIVSLSEWYYDNYTINHSFKEYGADLVLENGDAKRYYDWTEFQRNYGHSTYLSECRVGVAIQEDFNIHPLDIIMATGGYYSKFIRDNYALYKVCLYKAFDNYAEQNGTWQKILSKWIINPEDKHFVQLYRGLSGVVCETENYPIKNASSTTTDSIVTQICQEAERNAIQIKNSGKAREFEFHENLHAYLTKQFLQLEMFLEARPTFSNGQILPIYIPYRDIVICTSEMFNQCDKKEIARRNIQFIDVRGDIDSIKESLQKSLVY